MIDRIQHGQGREGDLDLLNSVADNIQGRTICALGDAAAMPVRAMDQTLPLISKNHKYNKMATLFIYYFWKNHIIR